MCVCVCVCVCIHTHVCVCLPILLPSLCLCAASVIIKCCAFPLDVEDGVLYNYKSPLLLLLLISVIYGEQNETNPCKTSTVGFVLMLEVQWHALSPLLATRTILHPIPQPHAMWACWGISGHGFEHDIFYIMNRKPTVGPNT